MAWIAFTIIAVMLLQHWEIHRRTETANNWQRNLQHYRRTVRWAVLLSALFVFASIIVFALDVYANGGLDAIARAKEFLDSDGPVSVLIIAFFVGIARLFAERALDTKENPLASIRELIQSFFASDSLKRQSSIGNLSQLSSGSQRDPWFAWLCFSLAVSIVDALLNPPSSEQSASADFKGAGALILWCFAGFAACLYVAIGYFLWVYMTLYLKLVQHHHFTGRAARLFLGGLFRDQLPRQCTVIGPISSGKTVFARQGHVLPFPHTIEPTSRVDIRTAPAAADDGTTLNLTTLDTPGENMGDHILLASTFRSDVLVLVLDLGMFDPEAMEVSANYSLANWHNLIRHDDAETVKRTISYMQGFHLATTRSLGQEFVHASELFKVRAFTLFLNRKDPKVLTDLLPLLQKNMPQLQQLSRDIGERLGVETQECCCIAGNADSGLEALDLMAKSTKLRLESSFWPGPQSD